MRDDITAVILAGGKATRLGGIAKHAIVVEGRTILDRQCDVLARLVGEIVVSSNLPIAGRRTAADVVVDGGPLAGIAAGLAVTVTEWALVVAGDMPHLSSAIVELLLSHTDAAIDAVGIRIADLPEPLLCVLRVDTFRPILARRLAERRLKASALLTDEPVRVSWLDEAAVRAVSPDLRGLHNVNAPGDL